MNSKIINIIGKGLLDFQEAILKLVISPTGVVSNRESVFLLYNVYHERIDSLYTTLYSLTKNLKCSVSASVRE